MSVKGIENQTNGIYDVQTIDIFDVFDVSISVLTLIVVTIGMVGNVALVHTFWKKNEKRKKKEERTVRFNILMIVLGIFDILILIPRAIDQIVQLMGKEGLPPWGQYLLNSFFDGSVFTTVGISIERFFALCLDQNLDKFPIWLNVLGITLVSFLLNLDMFTLEKFDHFWFNFSTCTGLPVIVLVILNVMIYIQLKQILKQYQKSSDLMVMESMEKTVIRSLFQAKVTIGITIMFLTASFFYWVPTFLQLVSILSKAERGRPKADRAKRL